MEHFEQQQLTSDEPAPQLSATNLIELVKQLIKEKQYDGVALLFTSGTESERNVEYLKTVGSDLCDDICIPNLTRQIHDEQLSLYNCSEELLYLIAKYGPMEELFLELLELIEQRESEYVFSSSLRALQVVLLRMGEKKPRALEWSLNSIHTRIERLPLPKYLQEGYDKKQARLLEQNEEIEKLLIHYITLNLFYEPLLNDILSQQSSLNIAQIFCNTGFNRRNVLCCFLIQMLGRPLALLDLKVNQQRTNTYTIQCARKLTESATKCLVNPLRLLFVGEERVRWKCRLDDERGVHEMSSSNIFLIEKKLPLESLAIYFYMLFVEKVSLTSMPKIYSSLYIFESSLYYVNELLAHEEPALHERALLLAKCRCDNLYSAEISSISLQLEVHKNFCNSLCKIIGYSSQNYLRQMGIKLLRQYILQFDDDGKYLIIKNLMRTVAHNGISGYLAILYKDLVANALVSATTDLPSSFSGKDFYEIFLKYICRLPNGEKTDLIAHSDKVISSLNALRFLVIKDLENRTGLWDIMPKIEKKFVDPLRRGLDISAAHYKAELKRMECELDAKAEAAERKNLEILDINIANATSESGKLDAEFTRQRKTEILNQNLCTVDLIRSLLGRTVECVESSKRVLKSATI